MDLAAHTVHIKLS